LNYVPNLVKIALIVPEIHALLLTTFVENPMGRASDSVIYSTLRVTSLLIIILLFTYVT